ncbi:hypothetical protein [Desulfonema magnum]|nr:hypothetical protein [Desulfonema magnum]
MKSHLSNSLRSGTTFPSEFRVSSFKFQVSSFKFSSDTRKILIITELGETCVGYDSGWQG